MSRYFTSDLHLGSNLINKYAHRPFTSAEDAVKQLTDNIRETCFATDTLIHVGDFMLAGADRHGEVEDKNVTFAGFKATDFIGTFIRPRIFLIAGNHDDGHNCEADAKFMVLDLNQNYKNVLVAHYPSTHNMFKYNEFDRRNATKKVYIQLCGHVHDKWLLKYDKGNNVLNINVGVDVWNYKPVRDSEITKILDFVFDINHTQVNKTHFDRTWMWTRKDYEHFVEAERNDAKLMREKRKQEKYAKKGLTKEECERRKREAMAKKGVKKNA